MPSTLIVWPEAGIPMNSCCREPVTTHRVATVSPLAMMSCRSSSRSGKTALKNATFCLKPASVAELVDRRLVGRAERGLEARDDLDVVGHGQSHDSLQEVATDWLLLYSN